jgi:hypothetical protein
LVTADAHGFGLLAERWYASLQEGVAMGVIGGSQSGSPRRAGENACLGPAPGVKLRYLASIVGVCLAFAVPVRAHHSFSIFDVNKTITISGTVQRFQWSSPHSWIDLMVPKEGGQGELWSVECGAPGLLARHGWTKESLKPGDKIKLDLHPLKTGRSGGACLAVTLADGKRLDLGSSDIYKVQKNVLKKGTTEAE